MDHLIITPSDDLITQQAELEKAMTEEGIQRYRQKVADAQEKGREDATTYGTRLLDHLIGQVQEAITTSVEERKAGRAGRKGAAFKLLREYEGQFDVVAYITLKAILRSITRTTVVQNVAAMIGTQLEDELRYQAVREQDNRFYQWLKEQGKQRVSYANKRKALDHYIAKREVIADAERWSRRDAMALGQFLIEVVIRYTNLVQKEIAPGGRKADTSYILQATPETMDFVHRRNSAMEMMLPVYEPMVVPPVDWRGAYGGGYLTRNVRPYRLLKTRNKFLLESFDEKNMDIVYEAVNTAQRTPWQVNPFILDVLSNLWETGSTIGDLPARYDEEIPPKPFDIETNEEARLVWRKSAAAVHRRNIETRSRRLSLAACLATATKYSQFEAIYFPYQYDFRGRIYAVPAFNPQGPDFMKALLQFSEGKPLDEESAPFLAIQLANTGAFDKVDKASLEDRVQWVYDNQEKIIACADDPYENRWWEEADSPYCFLAACKEWAGWVEHGEGFISHLPVALDGSCSGIQHFSMALADEVGGAAVNLVPSEKPADIYSLVMEASIREVEDDAEGDDEEKRELAKQWLRSGLMTRSCFKRPTMTYGYGSGQFGFRSQIEDDTLRPAYQDFLKNGGNWFFEGSGFKASVYLARIVFIAVEKVVVKAAEAMRWLTKAASLVASEDQLVRWHTPDGFPVVQPYLETKAHRVDTTILGSRVTYTVREETQKVDRRKQSSGFSPNFVHSLDATHLRLAVVRAAEEGINAFALVHDSFGVHAADTGRFFAILRETLVELYTTCNPFEDLHSELHGMLLPENREQLPTLPAYGSLDREAVLDSDFAFA